MVISLADDRRADAPGPRRRISFERSNADTTFHAEKPAAAFSSAASRSARAACATEPTRSPVTGFKTGMDRPCKAGRHLPPMNNRTSGYVDISLPLKTPAPRALVSDRSLNERYGSPELSVFSFDQAIIGEKRRLMG